MKLLGISVQNCQGINTDKYNIFDVADIWV